jgi:chromosome segregation ATPase
MSSPKKMSPRVPARPGYGGSTARKETRAKKRFGKLPVNTAYVNALEDMVDRFNIGGDDNAVDDVGSILSDIRAQYDDVRYESERKEKELNRIRNLIRQADSANGNKQDEVYKLDDTVQSLTKQFEESQAAIDEAQINRKVYEHMLERLKKEQAIMRQKLLRMEEHLARKQKELAESAAKKRSLQQAEVASCEAMEIQRQELDGERELRVIALERIKSRVEAKNASIKRRADFERWRHVVALEAANEAFNASAGRLRTMWALEKLSGNCLQKVIFEQVEQSQMTEDGFQKIREVTGLTDVMDIVHKFLNRDVEHEQLKSAVAEAESKLESLLADFELFKRQTEGIVPQDTAGSQRGIYQEVEDVMGQLQQKLKSHANAKDRLQKLTLAFEDVKRWGKRFHDSMRPIVEEECALDSAQEVVKYFQGLVSIIQHFTQHALTPATTKKRLQQARDEKAAMAIQNCKANFRINLDRKGNTNDAKQDPDGLDSVFTVNNDRNKFKDDSNKVISEAMRRTQKEKKQRGNAALPGR